MSIAHLDMIPTIRALDALLPSLKKIKAREGPVQKNSKKTAPWSPYLELTPKPKIFHSKPPSKKSTSSNTADLHPYNVWNDPKFQPKNEENRWFALQSPCPAVVLPTRKSGELIAEGILNSTLLNIETEAMGKVRALCLKHRKQAETERQNVLLEKLESYKSGRASSPLQKKILEQIEADVEKVRAELETLLRQQEDKVIATSIVQDLITQAASLRFVQPLMECDICLDEYQVYKEILDQQLCRTRGKSNESFDGFSNENAHNEEIAYDGDVKYFQSSDGAYKFNYETIFDEKPDPQEPDPVKVAMTKHFPSGEESIEAMFKEMWQNELKNWQQKVNEQKEKDQKAIEEPQFQVVDNPQEIRRLLHHFLSNLAQDPFYMLPTLPDAHKLPLLNEWVRSRYGFKHTRAQKKKLVRESKLQWDVLIPSWPSIRPPGSGAICPGTSMMSWDYRERIGKITKLLRDEYEREMKLCLIEINRSLWTSFEPFQCNPRLREIFYAYCAGCEKELHPFRPWKTEEFKHF